jgi:radical SAM superfamily enzyme YgiQ (UPF0313 family)
MNKLALHPAAAPAAPALQAEALLDRLFPGRRIQRVLLVNPPDTSSEVFMTGTAKRRRYTNYPPYGLAILAETLRRLDVDVRILNLNHLVIKSAVVESEEAFDFDRTWQTALAEALRDFKPDLAGVTCMFTMTHTSFRRVCDAIGAAGVPVAIGGVHVTNDVERVLTDVRSASVAFLREGDNSLPSFVQAVNGHAPLESLGQVILIDGDERHRFLREVQPSEDQLNIQPAHDLIDGLNEYSMYGTVGAFYWLRPAETRFSTVLSNRGCRAACTFCSVRNFNGFGVRQRSITSVVDELERLRDEQGVRHVMWLDDDLLQDHARAIGLFNEMVRRDLGLTWDATNGLIAFSCTEDVIAAAEASGCVAVNIGMESGNPKILHQIKKPGKVDTFLKAAEVFRKHERIHSSVLLMLGFPGETMKMVFDTINVAREMDLDWYRISPLQPLPNTPIYDSMVAQGLIESDPSKVVFQGGAYGKQVLAEQGLTLSSPNFKEAFQRIPMDSVPTQEQITDIWFYMNYHLNFHRLFHEKRPVKLQQQWANLNNLTDVISPENGFALYFIGVLQHHMEGRVDRRLIDRLKRRMAGSPYWKDRLEAFGLRAEDLENPDVEIPMKAARPLAIT